MAPNDHCSATLPPLAIVGAGCRLPGDIESPSDLLEFALNERSAITKVPNDRWDADAFHHPDFARRGAIHSRYGGFIRDIDRFDAAFFGISPNEARRMDPQQRLMLEVGYRAIEDAGMRLDQLAGRNIAVAVGVSSHDYAFIQNAVTERNGIGPTSNTGITSCIVANRLSYLFDLRGPSVVVDTACSSALTALHHGCQSIWNGLAEAALVGGVNVLLRPELTMGFSKGGYLSPDGQCRAFSDHANGYVRSEGAGAVLIKPLEQALQSGDRVRAVLRSTWINQDGRSLGMTMPRRESQEEMLHAAYRRAGVDPAEVLYVEAHGTGTQAGDPIEAAAIGEVIGRPRDRGVCWIGSVKTNVGHLESGAGIAGLLKLIAVLEQRVIPPNLHFRAPNPAIDFERLRLRVPTEAVDVDAALGLGGRRLTVGINSFGFGGANAHAVLQSAPQPRESMLSTTSPLSPATVLMLSARSEQALRTSAAELAEHLPEDPTELEAIAATLGRHRSRFEHRLGVVGCTPQDLGRALARYGRDETEPNEPNVFVGRAAEGRPPTDVVFVFSGQGPQWWAMGRQLLERNPMFRATIDTVDRELTRLGWLVDEGSSLLEELTKPQAHSRIHETKVAQPAIYAIQLGVARVLVDHGVRPRATVGHSIGELAAAVCAGALTLQEGARLVYWRSHCQAQAEGRGLMAALGMSAEKVRRVLEPFAGEIELAAVNGPSSVTVAGDTNAVRRLLTQLEAQDVFSRELSVSVPFHCHLMDPIENDFRHRVGNVTSTTAEIPFFSTVDGNRRDGATLDVDYWYRNIRAPVLFLPAFEAMLAEGWQCFVEIGPHPILKRGAMMAIEKAGTGATYLPTLHHTGDESVRLRETLAGLFVAGASVDPIPTEFELPMADLPAYPFDRQRLWNESEQSRQQRLRPAQLEHPHLTTLARSLKTPEVLDCTLALDPRAEPYLAEHRIQGDLVVFPGAGQLELALAAGARAYPSMEVFVEDVEFMRPVVLPGGDEEGPRFRLSVYSDDGSFEIGSCSWGLDDPWSIHTRGRINHCGDRFDHGRIPALDVASLQERAHCAREVDVALLYQAAAKAGLDLGPSFQGIRRFWISPEETITEIAAPESLTNDSSRFTLHPALLDCLLQSAAMGELYSPDTLLRRLFLPSRVAAAKIHRVFAQGTLWCHCRCVERSHDRITLDIRAVDDDGEPVVTLHGLELTYIKGSAKSDTDTSYALSWQPIPMPEESSPPVEGGVWIVLDPGPDQPLGQRITRALRERGEDIVVLRPADASATNTEPGVQTVDPAVREHYDRALATLAPNARISGIIHAWALGTAGIGVEANAQINTRGLVPLTVLLAAIGERWTLADAPKIWLLTAGVSHVRGPATNVAAAKLWGLGRVLMAERPRLHTALLDLPAEPTSIDLEACTRALVSPPPAHELAINDGALFMLQLREQAHDHARAPVELEVERRAFRATVHTPGVVSSVGWQEFTPRQPRPHEVVVAVRAASLNFKDVAVAMGILGDDAWEDGATGAELGLDFSGVVVEVGNHEGPWSVGDEVLGVAAGSLANRVVVDAGYLVSKPSSLSWAEAAAVPTVYGTASLGLERIAHLQPGETVLVHAAAGGVGTAAINIAQRIGARIIATTSTDAKRSFLRELGVEHILHSRTPHFRQTVLDLTDGRGADVVLNSLSGRSMTQSIRALAPFGRFIEIGKTDIYDDRQLGLRFFGKNRSYTVVDFNRWIRGKTAVTQNVLASCVRRIVQGELQVPPIRCLPATELSEGMQFLARAEHIGKVVIEIPTQGSVTVSPGDRLVLDGEGTLLITGGCRGFGLAVAHRLAKRGARHLTLVGRSGLPGAEERAIVDQIRALGTEVRVVKCDVSDRESLRSLLATLRTERELSGVFHAAAVLDDAPIEALDHERFDSVGRPKADGAWLLHELTRDDPLRYFVLFSSVAGLLGSPGQGNYAAANVFLDELAHYRRAHGMVASSINFGVIGGVGMVARATEERRRRILGQGLDPIDAEQAVDALERCLLEHPVQRIVADINWDRVGELSATPDRAGRFAHLTDQSRNRRKGRQWLALLPHPERLTAIADALAEFVATLLGLDKGRLDQHTSTDRLGLDSLAGTQLQSWIEVEMGATVPLVRLLSGQTIHELASELAVQLDDDTSEPEAFEPEDDELTHRHLRPGTTPHVRLLCLPFMGADDEAFSLWAHDFDAEIELVTVRLPSLEGPRSALLQQPIEHLREALLEAIWPLLDRPFGLYGHSMGGWIALDLAAALEQRNRRASFVAVGALLQRKTLLSLIPRGLESPQGITDEVIREAMAQMQINPSILADPGRRSRVMTRVRRDLWLGYHSGFLEHDESPLECPIVVLGGRDDPLATVDDLPTQRLAGQSIFAHAKVPGGHLFLGERDGRLAAVGTLRPLLRSAARHSRRS